MVKLSKLETEKKINEFFKNIKNKTSNDIKKIKKLAMHHHISLNKYKKLFCSGCFSVFNKDNSETRMKKGFKIIKCKRCNKIKRINLNNYFFENNSNNVNNNE